jgi:hypothetical protein
MLRHKELSPHFLFFYNADNAELLKLKALSINNTQSNRISLEGENKRTAANVTAQAGNQSK